MLRKQPNYSPDIDKLDIDKLDIDGTYRAVKRVALGIDLGRKDR